MPDRELVSSHYTHGRLVEAIAEGVGRLGTTLDDVTVADLAPVDEFHVGGRVATEAFLDQLGIEAAHEVLDVGCGLGGASRFAAERYGCRVRGIDLTPEYVATGNTLCAWVGLAEVHHDRGDADAMYEALAKAIELNPWRKQTLQNDSDFEDVRGSERFRRLVGGE